MLRQSFWRISAVAVIFFALPAVLAALGETLLSSALGRSFSIAGVVTVIAAVGLRGLGPIAFAGFLDEAVAKEYLHGERSRLRPVLRSLPWRRLIAADIIVMSLTAVGLAAAVVPGLVVYGLFGLIGPVVVQEHAGVIESLRRASHLSLRAPRLVILLVVIPFAGEQIAHTVILGTLHSYGLGVEVLAEWILAIVLGGTLGLLEVALATELMARNPHGAQLLDDGKAPAV